MGRERAGFEKLLKMQDNLRIHLALNVVCSQRVRVSYFAKKVTILLLVPTFLIFLI